MELTLDQALQKGIEAHKAGNVREADQYYTAILKANPKHPDANHNMGVLAVGLGKVEAALPFFKTALETNKSVAQYWLSYIDALIKLGRFKDAKDILDQAKSNGAKGDGFDQLEKNLKEAAINKTKNVTANTGGDPTKDKLQPVIDLYTEGKLQNALDKALKLLTEFPKSTILYNIIGAVYQSLDEHDKAINAYNNALSINPKYTDALYNLANALQDQENLEEAIKVYKKTLSIDPYYTKAYNNMGIVLIEQGKLKQAVAVYNKALIINPDYGEAYYNMANALEYQGKIKKAIASYKKALALIPNSAETVERFLSLENQLNCNEINAKPISVYTDKELDISIRNRPKYQIGKALSAFLNANLPLTREHINNFNHCYKAMKMELKDKDRRFCTAYCEFLTELIKKPNFQRNNDTPLKSLFHLGESHCLSYAHHLINFEGLKYQIVPRITFGAKAFHFSQANCNQYKAITKANFDTIPDRSTVFLSFGEIDCRSDEGFISAAYKINKPIRELIFDTVTGYLKWFFEQNKRKKHKLFFYNLPAPVYDQRLDRPTNAQVASIVKLFNNFLSRHSVDYNFKIIDVFQFTVGENSFSNQEFHVDKHHLGPKALKEVERQLN